MPSLWWALLLQLLLAGTMLAIAPWISRKPKRVWQGVCIGALVVLFAWPLFRFFPVPAIRVLGAPIVSCIELTGLFIPATLLLGIASRHVPRPSDRRAIVLLIVVGLGFCVYAGRWMLQPAVGNVPDLRTKTVGAVTLQSTDYTCVAASMVTMLRAFGVDASETQMARLSRTEVGRGATDSRALWALELALAGTPLKPTYRAGTLSELIAAPKPCLVQIDFGFVVSHMVPVMAADEHSVTLGDPLTGPRTLSTTEFARLWKKTMITLEGRSDATPVPEAVPTPDSKPGSTTVSPSVRGSAPLVNKSIAYYRIASSGTPLVQRRRRTAMSPPARVSSPPGAGIVPT